MPFARTILLPWPFRRRATAPADRPPVRRPGPPREALSPPPGMLAAGSRRWGPRLDVYRVPGPYCVHVGEVYGYAPYGVVGEVYESGQVVGEVYAPGEVEVRGKIMGEVYTPGGTVDDDAGAASSALTTGQVYVPGPTAGQLQCEMDPSGPDGRPL